LKRRAASGEYRAFGKRGQLGMNQTIIMVKKGESWAVLWAIF
jgi:hypothetical protein